MLKKFRKLKLDVNKDIKPYFYIRGNFDLIRCTDHIKFKSVFDVGCGKGGAALYFANQGKEVTAITIGEEFHSYRQDWFDAFNIDVEIGDFSKHKTDKKYDAVWMSHSLEHTQYPGQFLKNAWNMLNDDGWLFVLVPPYNHLLTSGHFSTGWNMGTLMYNLLISGFDIKNAHYVRYGSNLCAFIQKADASIEPDTYVSIDDSKDSWPVPVYHHASLEDIYQINWFDSFKPKLAIEADKRKKYKTEENRINNVYLNAILDSPETEKKLKAFSKKYAGKKVVCYGAGGFSQRALKKFDFSNLNIIGFVDADRKKVGGNILGHEVYPLDAINREIKPDVILMTCVKKMWGKHHVLPIQVKKGLGNVIIDDEVFSL